MKRFKDKIQIVDFGHDMRIFLKNPKQSLETKIEIEIN